MLESLEICLMEYQYCKPCMLKTQDIHAKDPVGLFYFLLKPHLVSEESRIFPQDPLHGSGHPNYYYIKIPALSFPEKENLQ